MERYCFSRGNNVRDPIIFPKALVLKDTLFFSSTKNQGELSSTSGQSPDPCRFSSPRPPGKWVQWEVWLFFSGVFLIPSYGMFQQHRISKLVMSTCSPACNVGEISAHPGTLFIACACEGGCKLRPEPPPLITLFLKKKSVLTLRIWSTLSNIRLLKLEKNNCSWLSTVY